MPIVIIMPILGWSWVMLSPLVMAAAGALGFQTLTDIVAEELGREERLDFKKGTIILTFRKDARGKFHIEVTGPKSLTMVELLAMGDEFARMIIQQFAHHRIARELDLRGVHIVGEEVDENGDIILHTRKWS